MNTTQIEEFINWLDGFLNGKELHLTQDELNKVKGKLGENRGEAKLDSREEGYFSEPRLC